MQLLRTHIAYELSTSCKFESPSLASAIETFNKYGIFPFVSRLYFFKNYFVFFLVFSAILSDISKHYRDTSKPYPSEESFLLYNLASQLDAVGLGDPAMKIYVTTTNLNYLSALAFLFSLSQISKLHYTKSIGKLM